MALIKTGGGVTDIRGTVGGDVYKRDKSGLHITAKSRIVKKIPSTKQQLQQNWYTTLKRTEGEGGEVDNAITKSPDIGCVKIYAMRKIYATRTTHFGTPQMEGVVYAGAISPQQDAFYARWYHDLLLERSSPLAWAYQFITESYPDAPAQMGMTLEEMAAIVSQYYRYYKGVEHMTNPNAEMMARIRFGQIINEPGFIGSRNINGRGYMTPGETMGGSAFMLLMIGAMVLGESNDYRDKLEGGVQFSGRRVLIEIGDVLVFGSVLGRPSKNCIDYAISGAPAFHLYTINYWPNTYKPVETRIDTLGLFTTNPHSYGLFSFIYTWGKIECGWWGSAYEIEMGVYRHSAPPGAIELYGIPVGFYYPPEDVYGYPSLLPLYWRPFGEEWPVL